MNDTSVETRQPGTGVPEREGTDPGRSSSQVTVIEPSSGWRVIDWAELWRYRDLFYFLVWRDIKGRYAQSVLGVGWAIVQPLMTMVVFSVVFGHLASIGSDGVPYAVFSYVALVPRAYFSGAVSEGTGSIAGGGMIAKVYFPRMVMPLTPIFSKLVDFAIASVITVGLMAWFLITPTAWTLMLPLLVLVMMLFAAGLGMWLTALAVQYRDIRFALPFVLQLMMYASPVVYPASLIPSRYRLLYGLNPMAGVIEGFRSALLGTNPMPWGMIAVGAGVAVLIAVSGAFFFRRRERVFVDVA